jgi:hypothetical protein
MTACTARTALALLGEEWGTASVRCEARGTSPRVPFDQSVAPASLVLKNGSQTARSCQFVQQAVMADDELGVIDPSEVGVPVGPQEPETTMVVSIDMTWLPRFMLQLPDVSRRLPPLPQLALAALYQFALSTEQVVFVEFAHPQFPEPQYLWSEAVV